MELGITGHRLSGFFGMHAEKYQLGLLRIGDSIMWLAVCHHVVFPGEGTWSVKNKEGVF
jgi:hypothetical protein